MTKFADVINDVAKEKGYILKAISLEGVEFEELEGENGTKK